MLELTESAKHAVREMVTAEEAPAGSGLRISAEPGDELSLEVAAAPAAGDTVVDEDGARVFLEPAAASMLDDMVLDVEQHEDHVHFVVGAQPSSSRNGAAPG
jgi:Fe-S cluster assembly iron-binding protein IscA